MVNIAALWPDQRERGAHREWESVSRLQILARRPTDRPWLPFRRRTGKPWPPAGWQILILPCLLLFPHQPPHTWHPEAARPPAQPPAHGALHPQPNSRQKAAMEQRRRPSTTRNKWLARTTADGGWTAQRSGGRDEEARWMGREGRSESGARGNEVDGQGGATPTQVNGRAHSPA